MIGIRYNSLGDLNGQAPAWCNKVNGRMYATTNEVPLERLKRGSTLSSVNISLAKSICAGYRKTASFRAAVIRIPCHRNTPAKRGSRHARQPARRPPRRKANLPAPDILSGKEYHHQCASRRMLTVRQSFGVENTLLDGDNVIDIPIHPHDLSRFLSKKMVKFQCK